MPIHFCQVKGEMEIVCRTRGQKLIANMILWEKWKERANMKA
jgi:hypothetical protein